MKYAIVAAGIMAVAAFPAAGQAQDRYVQPPPVMVSPDLSAPWVMQLRRAPVEYRQRPARVRKSLPGVTVGLAPDPVRHRHVGVAAEPVSASPRPEAMQRRGLEEAAPEPIRTSALAAGTARKSDHQFDPKFLPQTVVYDGPHQPGTIVIDTAAKFLYLVEAGGQARRYGVGVGKEGFLWKGTETISQKREWPDWRPPAEMIAREKKKGRILPVHMEGGPANPLGARALYLGSTLYRIHGTNAPWTIGGNVSSGCIRMRNEDVIDLYERVNIGTKVVVI
ncbi:MAG TPA: L,D-transpeptidase family protein [Rhizobiaceae bacterium]|nr:L,D-transpeptidase family protein [Rhizobiaceae bacterium]